MTEAMVVILLLAALAVPTAFVYGCIGLVIDRWADRFAVMGPSWREDHRAADSADPLNHDHPCDHSPLCKLGRMAGRILAITHHRRRKNETPLRLSAKERRALGRIFEPPERVAVLGMEPGAGTQAGEHGPRRLFRGDARSREHHQPRDRLLAVAEPGLPAVIYRCHVIGG